MADNYLERKYEEYQSKKSSSLKSRQDKKKGNTLHKMRRVFVIGGAGEIGKVIVKVFRMAGNRVAFCDSNEAAGKEIAEKTGTTFHLLDIGDKEALSNCMQQILNDWGDLDIIIHTANIDKASSPTETVPDDFDRIISANLRPAFITSRLLALHRQSQCSINPYGRIINISSPIYQTNERGNEIYAASNGGLQALTQALSISLAPLHITVNSIIPGKMQTCTDEQLHLEETNRQPSEQTAKPEDIARTCLFFCQEENEFISGENIIVGGRATISIIQTNNNHI